MARQSKTHGHADLHMAVHRRNARQMLILQLPRVRPVVSPLLRSIFDTEPSLEAAPIRGIIQKWADAFGISEHWFTERLVGVMLGVRRFYQGAEDTRLFDERLMYALSWVTYDDQQGPDAKHQAEAEIHRLRRQWRRRLTSRDMNAALSNGPDAMNELWQLRPIDADPSEQTRQEFIEIAGKHYDARARRLNELGYAAKSGRQPRKLRLHALWFIRHRFARETFDSIANQENTGDWTTVRDAVAAFAMTVGLTPHFPKVTGTTSQPE